jgi:hypothetical protein
LDMVKSVLIQFRGRRVRGGPAMGAAMGARWSWISADCNAERFRFGDTVCCCVIEAVMPKPIGVRDVPPRRV